MAKPIIFEIIVGTYEQFLLGYKFCDQSAELKQSFAVRSHTGSIKCVHISNRFLASGGADDRIFVYDLVSRKEHCMLTQHNATVNCVQFTNDRTHIISGCTDGTLTVVRTGNWQLEKIWEKAHKGSILSIAVHPSGKLALTLGADHSLRTWNLVKGRQAYIINLNSKSADPKSLERISWAPCTERFVLAGGQYTEIWGIESGGILKSIKHSSKVTCCSWLDNDTLLVGYENGNLAVVNTDTSALSIKQCHNVRIKGIAVYSDYIITASSNGDVKVWNTEFKEIAACKTGCRITCLDIAPPIIVKQDITEVEESKQSKRDLSEEEDEISPEKNEASDGNEVHSAIKKKKHRKKKKKVSQ